MISQNSPSSSLQFTLCLKYQPHMNKKIRHQLKWIPGLEGIEESKKKKKTKKNPPVGSGKNSEVQNRG